MKARDIEIGERYSAKVSGKWVNVQVLELPNPFLATSYRCINLETNRTCYMRTAGRFRAPIKDTE